MLLDGQHRGIHTNRLFTGWTRLFYHHKVRDPGHMSNTHTCNTGVGLFWGKCLKNSLSRLLKEITHCVAEALCQGKHKHTLITPLFVPCEFLHTQKHPTMSANWISGQMATGQIGINFHGEAIKTERTNTVSVSLYSKIGRQFPE